MQDKKKKNATSSEVIFSGRDVRQFGTHLVNVKSMLSL